MRNENVTLMIDSLRQAGISLDDAFALRRISMSLQRWHELECGDGNAYCSWAIERACRTPDGWKHDENGNPYILRYWHDGKVTNERIPDREKGALKRLDAIMARYPGLSAYVQGDPRGAALYIIRPGDVPEGCDVNAYYSHGMAVYK